MPASLPAVDLAFVKKFQLERVLDSGECMRITDVVDSVPTDTTCRRSGHAPDRFTGNTSNPPH